MDACVEMMHGWCLQEQSILLLLSVKWHIVCIMLSPTLLSHQWNVLSRSPGHGDAPCLWTWCHHLRLLFSKSENTFTSMVTILKLNCCPSHTCSAAIVVFCHQNTQFIRLTVALTSPIQCMQGLRPHDQRGQNSFKQHPLPQP
jgi:hypothetical protein